MAKLRFFLLIVIFIQTNGLANTYNLLDGDSFPSDQVPTSTKQTITRYRFLPKTAKPSFTSTQNLLISKETMVFLPPSVESVKIEPNTYKPTELSDGIQSYYSSSLVWYGVFYALYFFMSN